MLALTSEHELIQCIELAEGDALQACHVSDHQRRLILTILYAYRACYFQRGVSPDDTQLFFRLVAEAATALDNHEPADAVLEELSGYIRSAFPDVRAFLGRFKKGNSPICYIGSPCSLTGCYRTFRPTTF